MAGFIAALIRHQLVQPEILRERMAATPLDDSEKDLLQQRLLRLIRENQQT